MRRIFIGARNLARAIVADISRENCRIRHKSKWTRPAKGLRDCPVCGRQWTKGGYRKSYIRNCAP
jgi:ribosomal protein L37AE/L43A